MYRSWFGSVYLETFQTQRAPFFTQRKHIQYHKCTVDYHDTVSYFYHARLQKKTTLRKAWHRKRECENREI